MSWILLFLIFFFLFLLLHPFFIVIREGVKNKSGSSTDSSGNNSSDLEQRLEDLSGNVADLQTQVNGILQSQQQYTNQMAPAEPNITGAVDSGPTTTSSKKNKS